MKKQSYKKTVLALLKILRILLNTTIVSMILCIISWIIPYFDMIDVPFVFITISLLFFDFLGSLALLELLRRSKTYKVDDDLIPSV